MWTKGSAAWELGNWGCNASDDADQDQMVSPAKQSCCSNKQLEIGNVLGGSPPRLLKGRQCNCAIAQLGAWGLKGILNTTVKM